MDLDCSAASNSTYTVHYLPRYTTSPSGPATTVISTGRQAIHAVRAVSGRQVGELKGVVLVQLTGWHWQVRRSHGWFTPSERALWLRALVILTASRQQYHIQ